MYKQLAEVRTDDDARPDPRGAARPLRRAAGAGRNLLAVARFRARARQAGLTDVSLQGKHVRFGPVDLPDSATVRLTGSTPRAWSRPHCVRSWCRGRRPPRRWPAAARRGAAGLGARGDRRRGRPRAESDAASRDEPRDVAVRSQTGAAGRRLAAAAALAGCGRPAPRRRRRRSATRRSPRARSTTSPRTLCTYTDGRAGAASAEQRAATRSAACSSAASCAERSASSTTPTSTAGSVEQRRAAGRRGARALSSDEREEFLDEVAARSQGTSSPARLAEPLRAPAEDARRRSASGRAATSSRRAARRGRASRSTRASARPGRVHAGSGSLLGAGRRRGPTPSRRRRPSCRVADVRLTLLVTSPRVAPGC